MLHCQLHLFLASSGITNSWWSESTSILCTNDIMSHALRRHLSSLPNQFLVFENPGGLTTYERSSAAEWLQEALQKSCIRAGCSSSKFWLFRAAVESPLTAINSAFAAVQKIPESRSALQSGCKVASKRQRMLLLVMAYHSLVQKKEMQTSIIQ